jgi:hypothetical protein
MFIIIKCFDKKILSDTLPNGVGILPTQTSRIMNELYQFLNDSTDFVPLCIMARLQVGRMFNMSILSLDIGSQTDQVKTKDYQTNNNPRNSLNSIQRPKSSQFKLKGLHNHDEESACLESCLDKKVYDL